MSERALVTIGGQYLGMLWYPDAWEANFLRAGHIHLRVLPARLTFYAYDDEIPVLPLPVRYLTLRVRTANLVQRPGADLMLSRGSIRELCRQDHGVAFTPSALFILGDVQEDYTDA